MKPVSIETQKKLMFLPWLNILNLFIWSYNFLCMKYPFSVACKSIALFLGCSLPLFLLEVALTYIFPSSKLVISFIGSYLVPLCTSFAFIRMQEKLEHKSI